MKQNQNNTPKEILEKIKSCKKIVLPLHNAPDGDSIASCCAMKYLLKRDFDIDSIIVTNEKINENFHLIDFIKEIDFTKSIGDLNLKNYDLVLFLDHGAIQYKKEKLIKIPKNKTLNIDHHKTNTFFANMNYVDPDQPSNCSILINLFQGWKINFDNELSNRLLLGVYTDTYGFTKNKTAIKNALFLIENGADYPGIIDIIKYNVPFNIAKYFAKITENYHITKFGEYKIGSSVMSKKDTEKLKLNISDIRLGPKYLKTIAGVDLLFTLAAKDNIIKGSFRSKKNIDTSLIAKELGGGGHKFAAGFYLKKMPLKKAKQKVFDAIKKVGIHKVN